MQRHQGRYSAARQRPLRRALTRLGLSCACAGLITSVGAVWMLGPPAATARSRAWVAVASKLTKAQRKQIIALIRQFASTGASGPAGGALSGTYPGPRLNVSGGPCPQGQFLGNLSSLAALSCGPTGSNVALGENALPTETSVSDNTAVGQNALNADSFDAPTFHFGNNNTAVGEAALQGNRFGHDNAAFGRLALAANLDSEDNTAVGSIALRNNTGTNNIGLGFQAGDLLTSGANNIDIGNEGSAGDANKIKIGLQGTQTSTSIAGIDGATSTSGVAVLVNANGTLGTTTSSRRYKRDIHPLEGLTSRLMALRPVSFHYKSRYAQGGPNPLQFGLVAEQVAKVLPNLVADDKEGRPYEVRYQELPALLLAQVQRQQAQIDHQRVQIRWLLHQVRGR